jgi:ferredoxin
MPASGPMRRLRTSASPSRTLSRCILDNVTYVIAEPCIGVKDASCVDVCPVDCIHTSDEAPLYYIDPDECIDCGACEPECPVTAIFAEDAVPDQWTNFLQINADFFKK